MMMPVVQLRAMAMNESVAATCCYRESASPTNTYWATLNGGWIGQAYAPGETKWDSLVHTSWKWLDYDVSNVDDGSILSYSVAGSVTLFDVGGVSLDSFLNDGTHKKLGSCKHADGSCAYISAPVILKPNQHCGSKSKHDTGGTAWSKPHDAKQWGS